MSKWLAYYIDMRSALFDSWLRQKLSGENESVIIHIDCGMYSRICRVNAPIYKWYDVDFAVVIKERKRYFTESDNYRMIPADVRELSWLDNITEGKKAVVALEAISMYLKPYELKALTTGICDHFEHVELLMDCYSILTAKLSKYKNPINDVGVSHVYGMDDPMPLQSDKLKFVTEHDMTPQQLIDQLQGIEKAIFNKLYAGTFSRKLYKLFEYRKA